MEIIAEDRKIEIEQETLNNLNTTRKWTMFIAILGFIFLGLLIVVGAIAGTFLMAFNSNEKVLGIPESLMFIPLLFLALVYFPPVLFLFRFSKHAGHAVHTFDKKEMHGAIRNLKLYFAYLGVLIIVILTFYVAVLIITGTSLGFLKGLG
jgi:Na+/phosphate symporter